MNDSLVRPATPGRLSLIRDLIAEITALGAEHATAIQPMRDALNEARVMRKLDDAVAKDAISELIAYKRSVTAKPAPAKPAAKREIPEVPDGRYALPGVEDPEATRFFRVKVNGGYYEVYAQASAELHKLRYPSFIKVLEEIVAFGVRESLIMYGHKLKVCGACGIELTKLESREAGIGPICASKR